jgi:hypothetical protein
MTSELFALIAMQRDGIKSVRELAVERLGEREHVAVTRLEPGNAVAAFEVEGGDAAVAMSLCCRR